MAKPIRNVGSIESSAAVTSITDGDGAYIDFASSTARFGAKGTAGSTRGVAIRTLNAGAAVEALAFTGGGVGTFASGPAVTAGTTALQATTVTSLVASGTATAGMVLRAGTYTPGDTSPSVLGVSLLVISNAAPTTITNFDDGVANQIIVLRFQDANTTINRDNCYLDGGANFTGSANDVIVLVCRGGNTWEQVAQASINS